MHNMDIGVQSEDSNIPCHVLRQGTILIHIRGTRNSIPKPAPIQRPCHCIRPAGRTDRGIHSTHRHLHAIEASMVKLHHLNPCRLIRVYRQLTLLRNWHHRHRVVLQVLLDQVNVL